MAPKRKANDLDIPAEKRRHEDTIEDTILKDGDYSRLEAMVRRVVLEVLSAQHQSPRLTPNLCGGISEANQFRLEFSSKLKQEYYTQNKILADERDDAPVQIVVLDVGSQSIVTEGPMSSSEIEICVLPGDFGSGDDGHQNWSREEFNANIIVRPREGRKQLLKGNTRITLKDGVALIRRLEFTDISKWVRTGKFRLAARSKEANVREAISEPLTVKDKRGMPIMKHPRPSLDSEIWRLRHIAKDQKYHKQLSDDGIETVRDFLQLLTANPSSLKEKFGSLSDKKWEDITENARDCVIDDNKHYAYRATERGLWLVFNSIYEVVKVILDGGQTYCSPETFTSADKRLVEAAKKEAYQNVKDFVPVNLEELLATPQIGIAPDGGAPPQRVDLPATPQGQFFDWPLLGDYELHYSSPSLLDDLQRFLHPDAPPSTPAGRKGKTVWVKIRAYFKWLILRRSLCS